MPIKPATATINASPVFAIAKALLQLPSVTPNDAGCQQVIQQRLIALGFTCETIKINGVTNLIAKIGNGNRHLAFNGHTDVVPPGPLKYWDCPPFAARIHNDYLYGRGAADMKTGLAAMLAACEQFSWPTLSPDITFWFLVTSDEEGEAEYGSRVIRDYLAAQNVTLEHVLIGEPTADANAGDTIKVGRRGSLSATLTLQGKQGHVAYPHQAVNAGLLAAHVVNELAEIPFAPGSPDFPGTSLQVTQIDTGEYADNIIPGSCTISFNVRYSADYSEQELQQCILQRIENVTGHYRINWERPCNAFLSQPQDSERCLIRLVEQAIVNTTGRFPKLSTAGGTSDGRFFASPDTQVVEVGVPNSTIHQINERVAVKDIIALTTIYCQLLNRWLK